MKDFILLSDFMTAVGETLFDNFGTKRYRILAEISDVKVYYNRSYAFLSLIEKSEKDIVATAGAVIWRDHFHIIRDFEKTTGTRFDQNLELVLEVELQFHNRYGLRISITGIDTSFTLGKLEQERQKTLDTLVSKHPNSVWLRNGEYRSANQLLRLPTVIQNIALIAAPGSDGRRDFIHEMENNGYGIQYQITEFPAQVQGDVAAGQIATQLEKIGSASVAFHSVCVVRGGGSNSDFSAFDSFQVGLAVADCKLPVFTGIGHERNVSITDLLCFKAQKTPTKCASEITEHNLNFLAFVQHAGDEIKTKALRLIEHYKTGITNQKKQLLKSAQWTIVEQKQWLNNMHIQLKLTDPIHTLKRGFALIYHNQKHISKSHLLHSGDDIEIRFADKTINATIHD